MLATDADIAAFYAMALDDPHLVPLVRNMHGLRPTCAPTAYEALVLAILGQQISTHVARMLRNLIIETYGDRITIGRRDAALVPASGDTRRCRARRTARD